MSDPADLSPLVNTGIGILNADAPRGPERTLLVLGIARSGTTMVAGALHQLGVPMCEKVNGVFEDVALSAAMESRDSAALGQLIQARNAANPVWGWKRPSLIQNLARVDSMLRGPEYVVVFRDMFAVANRNRIAVMSDVLKNMEESLRQYGELLSLLRTSKRRTLLLSYEKAMLEPELFVRALAEFAGVDDAKRIAAAREHVRPNAAEYLHGSRTWMARGRLETVEATQIAGFAFHQGRLQPVTVVIRVNGNEVAQVTADAMRPDLHQQHPSGQCGFAVALDAGTLRAGDLVSARIDGDPMDLRGSPVTMLVDPQWPARGGGYVGLAEDHVSGYAFISAESDPAMVEVLVNGRVVGTLPANVRRREFRTRLNHPTGACGFRYELPEAAWLKKGDLVSLRISGAAGCFAIPHKVF